MFICLFLFKVGGHNYSKKDGAILYFFFFSPLQKKKKKVFLKKKSITYLTSTILCTLTFQAAADAVCPRIFVLPFWVPDKRATLFLVALNYYPGTYLFDVLLEQGMLPCQQTAGVSLLLNGGRP